MYSIIPFDVGKLDLAEDSPVFPAELPRTIHCLFLGSGDASVNLLSLIPQTTGRKNLVVVLPEHCGREPRLIFVPEEGQK